MTSDIADSLGLKEAKGALVAGITEDGPAGKAGLKSGDAILAVNGQEIADARELSRDIAALKPGDKASLSIWRDGATRTVEVTVGKLPGEKLPPRPRPRKARAAGRGSACRSLRGRARQRWDRWPSPASTRRALLLRRACCQAT